MANVMSMSDATALIKESFARWRAKSPKFFERWKLINAFMTIIGGAYTTIMQILKAFHFVEPVWWVELVGIIPIVMGGYGWAMNNLVMSDSKAAKELPFTEKKNIQQNIKDNAIANSNMADEPHID